MSRERIIYPNEPEKWTWEEYCKEFVIHRNNIDDEIETCRTELSNIKYMMYGIIGSTPRDIVNENDDPIECIYSKMMKLINDLKFWVKRCWKLSIIKQYEECIDQGRTDQLYGTIDEDTNKKWQPYIYLCGYYADNEYTCEEEIHNNENVVDMMIEKLMMYAMSTPKQYKNDNCENEFENLFFDVREILDDEYDNIDKYIWTIYDWQFIMNNFNEDSYNSY